MSYFMYMHAEIAENEGNYCNWKSLTVAHHTIPLTANIIIVNLVLNLFACALCIATALLSYAGGAALANVMRTTMYGMVVDFAHKIGCVDGSKNYFRSFIYRPIHLKFYKSCNFPAEDRSSRC